MIDLYTWTTPNGRKASIMLEEVDLPYTVHPVNIGAKEQFDPAFLKISPNNKIPAIVDHDAEGGPRSVFESGAILIYLAEKTGQLLPSSGAARTDVLQWLMWQKASIGPMFGQYFHFARAADQHVPYAIERYDTEMRRLLAVMDKRLAEAPYLGGAYSIADIATYGWVNGARKLRANDLDWTRYPNVERWRGDVGARPAVQRGMKVPGDAEPYGHVRAQTAAAGD